MPSTIDFLAMVGLGFFGTGHCIGMCGPIVVAVPGRSGRFLPQLLYHTGRVLTYALIGGIVGAIGSGLSLMESSPAQHGGDLAGVVLVQTVLSAIAGLFLAAFAAVRIGLIPEPRWMSGPSPTRIPGYDGVSKRAAAGSSVSLFLWGMMLGTIPCGLSYAAFARALPSGGLFEGALLVLAFGLGTMPGLLLLGTAGARFLTRHRKLSDLVSGAVMAGMAVALLVDAVGVFLL